MKEEFTMSMYASKDDLIAAMRSHIDFLQSRLEELNQKVEELESTRDSLCKSLDVMENVLEEAAKNIEGLNQKVDDLEKENDSLKQDAARYRFVKTMQREMLLAWRGMYGFADEAIDAAMQANK